MTFRAPFTVCVAITCNAPQVCSLTQPQSLISLTWGQVRLLKPTTNHSHYVCVCVCVCVFEGV